MNYENIIYLCKDENGEALSYESRNFFYFIIGKWYGSKG